MYQFVCDFLRRTSHLPHDCTVSQYNCRNIEQTCCWVAQIIHDLMALLLILKWKECIRYFHYLLGHFTWQRVRCFKTRVALIHSCAFLSYRVESRLAVPHLQGGYRQCSQMSVEIVSSENLEARDWADAVMVPHDPSIHEHHPLPMRILQLRSPSRLRWSVSVNCS